MIRPEAFYPRTILESTDELELFEPVVGIVLQRNIFGEVEVDLGNGIIGVIPENEITVSDLSYFEDSDIPKQVLRILGTKVRALIIGMFEDHQHVLLSRKLSMLEAWEEIDEGCIFSASVIGYYGNGIFADIGNGISTFIPNPGCSSIKYSNPSKWFNLNQHLFVKIKKKEALYKVYASVKEAYPSIQDNDLIVQRGDTIVVRIGTSGKDLKNAYFCEFTPAISGIIDSNIPLEEGEFVVGKVKKVTLEGLKLDLLN